MKGTIPVLLIWRCISRGRLVVKPPYRSRLALLYFHLFIHALDNCFLNLLKCLTKLLDGDKLWNQMAIH